MKFESSVIRAGSIFTDFTLPEVHPDLPVSCADQVLLNVFAQPLLSELLVRDVILVWLVASLSSRTSEQSIIEVVAVTSPSSGCSPSQPKTFRHHSLFSRNISHLPESSIESKLNYKFVDLTTICRRHVFIS
jgi:hypothetical protein